jgi:hypothetical protein
MNSREHFADLLDETAEIFGPLLADPTASMWYGVLKIMAALIKAQQAPLSTAQLGVIRRELFGGMTSFQDLEFDERRTPGLPKDTNKRLSAAVSKLYESFNALDTRA